MATAPVMTTTTAGLGTSGALTGDATGLDGLFAALMSGEALPAPVGVPGTAPLAGAADAAADVRALAASEGMISVLLGAKPVDGVDAALALANTGGLLSVLAPKGEVQTDVQLGDAPALTVSGDEASVQAFIQKLKDVYQKIVVEGGLTVGQLSDSSELAGALTKLGMAPEEAAGVAERIQTMLKLLDEQQDVDEKTAGSLVAMMLAVMGQTVQPAAADAAPTDANVQALGLQIVSVAQPQAAGGVQAGALSALRMRMGGDVTRDLLGLDAPKDKETDAKAADVPRKVEVTVLADGDATIAMGLPEVKADDAAALPVKAVNVPVTDAQPSLAAQAATAVTTTGAAVKVAAEEKIEAPKGETYYKLQADKNGVETLDAVKPMAAAREGGGDLTPTAQPPLAQAMAATQAAAQADAAAGASYAQRMADIQAMVDRAQVGRQVAVQMQPLLEQGGGTVRINLNPRELGKITVELTVTEGRVHGAIAASEPAVVEQLARELHSLRHGLADAGLKLGEQGINLMLSNQGGNGQNGQQGQNSGQQATAGTARGTAAQEGDTGTGNGDALAANLAAWVAPDRLLDVSA